MARKSSSTAVQEELYPLPRDASEYDAPARQPFDGSRMVDLEAEQESPFLRAQKRVSVRRGSLAPKTAARLKWVVLALFVVAVIGVLGAALYRYGKHSWRFRIDSSDQIEVSGAQHVARAQILDVIGGDIGRNIFFVPLAQRQQQLEQIPWVESASVMRFVPNRLRVEIHERTPVAFARIGSHISLIDAGGILMELAPGPKHKYSFPVITGMNASEPLSTRAARMKNYNELVRQLDSGGARYSQDMSEVDLSDAEDVKVVTADPNGEVLVHLGDGNYLQRYKIYVTHVEAWRQQFEKLDSVDLRYDGQIIVNPDLQGLARQPALTPAAAKAALAAGVKNAAIVNYEKYVTHPLLPAPASKPAQAKVKAGAKPGPKTHGKSAPKTTAHRAATASRTRSGTLQKSAASHAPSAAPKTASKKSAPRQAAVDFEKANSTATTPRPNSTASSIVAKPAAPASSAMVGGAHRKPSPAIPKETSHN